MRKRICFCTTLGATIRAFLLDLSYYLIEKHNYDVTFISGPDEELENLTDKHIHFYPIPMKRGMALDGLKVIWQMYKIFRYEKFDIVQYSTKNAGTYAPIAAKMAGIKCRLYCQWGMMFAALHGIKRVLLKWDEKLICSLSTHIEVESFSMYEEALKHGIYKPKKAMVIWNGSACGVDLSRYDMTSKESWRKEYRKKYAIPMDMPVFGYCGRITRDKGLNELFAAFQKVVEEEGRDARLMIIGRDDNAETINPELFAWAKQSSKVIFTGYTREVPQHYSALDVFASLSYREGFGLVVIEAAAMGVPGIVSDALGQRDTITDGETGLCVRTHNVDDVARAIIRCIDHPEEVSVMGKKARKTVEKKYDQHILFHRLAVHRDEMVGRK